MRTQFVPGVFPSQFAPMTPICPSCKNLAFFKYAEPSTLMYGHQLDRYLFECGDCGQLITRIVDEDQL